MIWNNLPNKLKIYIFFLSAAATPIIFYSIWDLLHNSYEPGWIVLTILTVLTVPFFFKLPEVKTVSLIGDSYVMSIAMLYGWTPCIIATVCHSISASLLARRQETYKSIFNVASTVCCAWVYSNVYQLMNPGYSKLPSDILLPLVALTVTFFAFNSLSTATAICFSSGQKVFPFWVQNYLPLGMEFSVSSVSAALIVSFYQVWPFAPFLAAPIIGVIWGYLKVKQAKADEAERHLKEQTELYLRTVESLALAVDAKDQTTYGHIRRVKVYAIGLARLCGIKDPNVLMAIETGSLLHDIGKLAIDDYILNKPGRLSTQEFEKMKVHATAGDEILQQVRFPFPVAKFVRCHHERWDGRGYPDGLKAEEIPLGARILAIADSFDAIRYSRPYKLSINREEAIELLRAQSGTAYDPNLIELFINHIHELENAAEVQSDNMTELSFRKHFEKASLALPNTEAISVCNSLVPTNIPSELVQLAEFCHTVANNLDLRDIMLIVARRIARLVPYRALVLFLDGENDSVQAVYASGKYSDILQGHKLGMGKGISGWVAAHRRPMINTGPSLDFQGLEGDFSLFTDSLVVPILQEDESLGTISLYADESITYNDSHQSILQTLADLLAPLVAAAKKRERAVSENFIDPITQIHRVAYLASIGPRVMASAARSRTPTSLIYLEIKNLYQIVRLYGMNVGNSIIRRIADCLRLELRESDILVRYGHQAFAALLPGVRDEQAQRCIQRLKQQAKSNVLSASNGQNFLIDYRAGVASYPKDGATVFALLQSAQNNVGNVTDTEAIDNNVVDFFPRF